MSFIRFGLLTLALVSSACGANVVFGEDGGEGGNGADGSGANNTGAGNTGAGNQGGSTSTFNTTSSPDTTVGPGDACEQLCNQHGQCLDDGCFESCKQAYAPGCEAEADNLIRCLTENFTPSCELPDEECGGQLFAYQECVGNGEDCFTAGCDDGPGGCRCSGQCFGSQIEQSCAFEMGQARCDCFIDGEFWGSCEDQGNACSIEDGCCREFFFEG